MIEQALVTYLNTIPSVITALGGQKVYYSRAPVTSVGGVSVKMPYAVIRNDGGSRKRLTTFTTEPRDSLTIYVESSVQHAGLLAADTIRAALENYRGDMPPERDLHITCGTIRDLDGYQNSFRFLISVYVRYRQTTVFPN
jgi:hypothetical protein